MYCFACLVPRSVQRFSFQPDFDGVQSDFLSLTGWLSGLGIADGFTVEDQDLGWSRGAGVDVYACVVSRGTRKCSFFG